MESRALPSPTPPPAHTHTPTSADFQVPYCWPSVSMDSTPSNVGGLLYLVSRWGCQKGSFLQSPSLTFLCTFTLEAELSLSHPSRTAKWLNSSVRTLIVPRTLVYGRTGICGDRVERQRKTHFETNPHTHTKNQPEYQCPEVSVASMRLSLKKA